MPAGQSHDNVLLLCCRSQLGTSIVSVCPIIFVSRIVSFTALLPLKVNTVFPGIVSTETILFWKLDCGRYSREEAILFFYLEIQIVAAIFQFFTL